MDASDAKPFMALLDTIAEGYDRALSATYKEWFFAELSHYDFQIVVGAFRTFTRSSEAKYGFPKPAHIIEIIEGTPDERDAFVWSTITTACRKFSEWRSVIVEDPRTAYVITRMFGNWAALVAAFNDSNQILWQAKRKEFSNLLRVARKLIPEKGEPTLLSGLAAMKSGGAQWFPSRQEYGVLLIDGRIELCYIPVDGRTGLPEPALRDVVALPHTMQRSLLPAARPVVETDMSAGADERELDPEQARLALQRIFDDWQRRHTMQDSADAAALRARDQQQRDAEDARKAELRRQHAETESVRSSAPVRAQKAAGHGRADRTANDRGEATTGRKGMAVRRKHRPKMGV